MKRVLLVLLAVAVLTNLSFAQESPAIKSGAKSLNFTFGGFGGFGLTGSGPSGGVSLSYFLSSDAAVRAGLQVRSTSTKTPYFNPGNPTETGSDGENSTLSAGVEVDYLMYAGTGRVRPYMGAGVFFELASSKSKPPVVTGGTTTETENGNPGDGTTFGLAGIVGAEVFIFNEVSLSAEYGIGLISITSGADVKVTTGNQSTTQKGPSTTNILGFGAAGATVHIYW